MTCDRCRGLMVREWFRCRRQCEPNETGYCWKCLNCGERIDRAILRHRAEQDAERAAQREADERLLREWRIWFSRMPVQYGT